MSSSPRGYAWLRHRPLGRGHRWRRRKFDRRSRSLAARQFRHESRQRSLQARKTDTQNFSRPTKALGPHPRHQVALPWLWDPPRRGTAAMTTDFRSRTRLAGARRVRSARQRTEGQARRYPGSLAEKGFPDARTTPLSPVGIGCRAALDISHHPLFLRTARSGSSRLKAVNCWPPRRRQARRNGD